MAVAATLPLVLVVVVGAEVTDAGEEAADAYALDVVLPTELLRKERLRLLRDGRPERERGPARQRWAAVCVRLSGESVSE